MTRINERIRVPEVRLIDDEGNQVGVLKLADALNFAQERDLDLVEVAPSKAVLAGRTELNAVPDGTGGDGSGPAQQSTAASGSPASNGGVAGEAGSGDAGASARASESGGDGAGASPQASVQAASASG